jgi:hypothetical protein
MRATFSERDIEGTAPALKVGILATVNGEGLPHMTLLSSLKAASPTTLTFGQFTEGLGKSHLGRNPKAGFLVMSLARKLWRGTASFTHTAKTGPEIDAYNREPLFRYNSYFGIHTVYFLDLVEQTGECDLPMAGIAAAWLATSAACVAAGRHGESRAINAWTRRLLSRLGNPKFASWVGADGHPRIVPVLQARAASRDRLLFSPLAYGPDLRQVPEGAAMAVFGMTLDMEDVLVRGRWRGLRRFAGIRAGAVEVDWLYNSMPPVPGQVYPPVELAPVSRF